MSKEGHSGMSSFLRKHLPVAFGGMKFYDQLLNNMADISPSSAWYVFHQQFINDVINTKKRTLWTGLPYLSPIQAPCSPGTVILLRDQTFKEMILRRPYDGCLAGTVGDFCPQVRVDSAEVMAVVKDEIPHKEVLKKVYQAKNSEKAVIITMTLQEQRRLVDFNKEKTFIDLDNFDHTGFETDRCYLVTHVLVAEQLMIEVTFNGDVFYEHTFTASLPVCFRAMKVWLEEEGRGKIERTKQVDRVLPVHVVRRSQYQSFFNAFIPNQAKLTVGDCPPVLRWREPLPIRSFRPRFLARPDRPSLDIFEMLPHDLDLMQIVNSTRGTLYGGATKEPQQRDEEQQTQRQAQHQE